MIERGKNLVKPEGQDRNVFNNLKRTMANLDILTAEQLAALHFETWDAARKKIKGKDV